LKVAVLFGALLLLLNAQAEAGFAETRNVIGLKFQTLSGPMKAFYGDVTSQREGDSGEDSGGYPFGAIGASFRSFGAQRLGAELTFSYASKKRWEDGLSLSTLSMYLGPVFSIPIVGELEYVVPYGCAGVAVVRSAVDIDSQIDVGLYLKLGIQAVITDQLGVTGALIYTRVNVRYDGSKGLGGANIIDKSYPVGDGSLVIELNYFP
jgi:hypothetical protein